MVYDNPEFDFAGMDEAGYEKVKKENAWGLTLSEFRTAQKRAGKPLTLTEAYILDSLWSDHCSYKNSKQKLKSLVRENSYVIKSENSDAGAVKIGNTGYCAVFKIESHNHPTLINPFDGAATGVGGILRDIFAMGAKNVGVGASLRYGPGTGAGSKDVLKGSTEGAASYCGTMGIPLVALDVYKDSIFSHNCLMNVSAIGIVKKGDLIPNVVPKKGSGYNLIYIGKPTSGAAVGGASFASQAFEEGKTKKIEFGSNPRLEKATFDVFEKVKKALAARKLMSEISLKDMGAAGLTCSTAEQVSARGYGIDIDTEKVPVPGGMNVHPLALAVGEDQERNMIIASKKATEVILDILNKDKDFKKYGGRAEVIGKVIGRDRFIMRDKNTVYCDIPLSLITNAPVYKPASKAPVQKMAKMDLSEPADIGSEVLKVISSANVYSRQDIFRALKSGKTPFLFTGPDETDVCVIRPLMKDKRWSKTGIALVFGGKSLHGREGAPAEQAYLATVSARLKLAAAGLKPVAAADGCNYGNPGNPVHYYCFSAGIDGLNKACRIPIYGEKDPLAVVAGNVSLKNTYISGGKEEPVDPSLIPAVFGYISDCRKTVTTGLKKKGSVLLLAGRRKEEMKGSEYAAVNGKSGGKLPSITQSEAGAMEYGALEASGKGLLLSSAVIENGGLAAALARMISLGRKGLGIRLSMDFAGRMRMDYALLSESPGYVIEVDRKNLGKVVKIYSGYGIRLAEIGTTTEKALFSGYAGEKKVFEIPVGQIREKWSGK